MTGEPRTRFLKLKRANGFPLYVFLTAIGLLFSGTVHGLWVQRWSQALKPPGSVVLGRVPTQMGEWVGAELPQLNHPRSVESLYRKYTNRVTNRSVHLLLISGDARTVADYPITRLFSGHGYRTVSDSSAVNIRCVHEGFQDRVLHAFVGTDYYEPASLKTNQLMTVSGWSANGIWRSPERPGSEFEDSDVVFQLYVTQTWDFAAQTRPNDTEDFLSAAIPRLSDAIGRMPDQADAGGSQR